MKIINHNLVFKFEGDLMAVHHGAIYHWHGDFNLGNVGNIPRAHRALNKGLKQYSDMQKPLSKDELRSYSIALMLFDIYKDCENPCIECLEAIAEGFTICGDCSCN